MPYKKILVDNPSCSRRFHVTFDDAAQPVERAQAECPFCGVVVFDEANHPSVKVARQENLIKTQTLSDNLVSECDFQDRFSRPPKPTV